jgi:hypothetical protein
VLLQTFVWYVHAASAARPVHHDELTTFSLTSGVLVWFLIGQCQNRYRYHRRYMCRPIYRLSRCKAVFTASMNSSLVRSTFYLPLLALTTLVAAMQCCAKLMYPMYNPGKQRISDSMPDTVGTSSRLRGACHCNLVPSSLSFKQIESGVDLGNASHARASMSGRITCGRIICTAQAVIGHLKKLWP